VSERLASLIQAAAEAGGREIDAAVAATSRARVSTVERSDVMRGVGRAPAGSWSKADLGKPERSIAKMPPRSASQASRQLSPPRVDHVIVCRRHARLARP
jgi:hypothetical protein